MNQYSVSDKPSVKLGVIFKKDKDGYLINNLLLSPVLALCIGVDFTTTRRIYEALIDSSPEEVKLLKSVANELSKNDMEFSTTDMEILLTKSNLLSNVEIGLITRRLKLDKELEIGDLEHNTALYIVAVFGDYKSKLKVVKQYRGRRDLSYLMFHTTPIIDTNTRDILLELLTYQGL